MVYMRAIFLFDCDSENEAKLILKSISPEIKQKIQKTNVTFKVKNTQLYLTIESDDVSSLRAACNSYLRWVNTVLEVKNVI